MAMRVRSDETNSEELRFHEISAVLRFALMWQKLQLTLNQVYGREGASSRSSIGDIKACPFDMDVIICTDDKEMKRG